MQCTKSKSLITSQHVYTPLGLYTVKTCGDGIHFLCNTDVTDQNFNPDLNTSVKSQADEKGDVGLSKPMDLAIQWLVTYFEDPSKISKKIPPVCFPVDESTDFERKVWLTLASNAMFGDTLSYAQLAEKIGNPKASRAVGTALKKNPVALIVPCHRIIRSDGTVGNYAGGKRNKVKEWLLEHEKAL